MTHRFMIEGVIFSIDGNFPSEVQKCVDLYEGEEKNPPIRVDGPLLKEQLKAMEVRFVQRDWSSFQNLPAEARSLVDHFIDFICRIVSVLPFNTCPPRPARWWIISSILFAASCRG